MAADSLHISISAEPLFSIGGLTFTNSMVTSLVVSALLIIFAFSVRLQFQSQGKPKGIQNLAEWIIESLHNLVYNVTGDLKKTRLFFPVVASFFLFILLNNWLGLLPGVGTIRVIHESGEEMRDAAEETEEVGYSFVEEARASEITQAEIEDHSDELLINEEGVELQEGEEALTTEDEHENTGDSSDAEHTTVAVPILRPGTADLNTTLALALFSVFLTQIFGFHYQKFGYFKKFINFSSPIMFFVGILELISEFAKIVSFAFRLFGNIFAGEVLLVVMAFLVPVIIPMPFYGLELFVGFIQALVFAMLSLVFFNMATHGHDEH